MQIPRWQKGLVLAFCLNMGLSPALGAELIRLYPAQSRVLEGDEIWRVAVGDPEIADVRVLSQEEILVLGKAPGLTTLHIWQGESLQTRQIQVLDPGLHQEIGLIREALAYPGVEVRQVEGALILSGLVPDTQTAQVLRAIAELFSPVVIDDLRLQPHLQGDGGQEQILTLLLESGLEVEWVTEEVVLLRGMAPDPLRLDLVRLARLAFSTVLDWTQPIPVPGHALAEGLGEGGIRVWQAGEAMILEGEVSRERDREAALALAELWKWDVVDRIHVHPEEVMAPLRRLMVNEPAFNQVQAEWVEGTLVLTGTVPHLAWLESLQAWAQRLSVPVISTVTFHDARPQLDRLLPALSRYDLELVAWGEGLILQGEVDLDHQDKILELVRAAGFQPLNYMQSPDRTGSLEFLQARLPAGVEASLFQGRLLLEGVTDSQGRQRALEISRSLFGEALDLLEVYEEEGPISIRVRAVEMDRSILKSWGVELEPIEVGLAPGRGIWEIGAWRRLDYLLAQLEFLEEEGKAQLLAEPVLVAQPGETASFLAGGEIPIPIREGGETYIQWKEYGIRLLITPEITRGGELRSAVTVEVSDLDWQNAVRVSGGSIPGVRTRRVETTVTVADGETLVLAGLLQEEVSHGGRGVHLLRHLPLVGDLFGNRQMRESQTELVILVTPMKGEAPVWEPQGWEVEPEAIPHVWPEPGPAVNPWEEGSRDDWDSIWQ